MYCLININKTNSVLYVEKGAKIMKRFVTIFTALMTLVYGCSCATLNAGHSREIAADSFVGIQVNVKVSSSNLTNDKEKVEIEGAARGSGFVISKTSESMRIVTAAHVCMTDDAETMMTLLIKSLTKGHSEPTFESQILVTNISGDIVEARVVMANRQTDICIIESEVIPSARVIEIAESDPDIGDRALMICGPHGIFGQGFAMMYEGLYSGQSGNRDLYGIVARPGCSGGMLLNEENEVIGMLIQASREFESFGVAVTRDDIESFIESVD